VARSYGLLAETGQVCGDHKIGQRLSFIKLTSTGLAVSAFQSANQGPTEKSLGLWTD